MLGVCSYLLNSAAMACLCAPCNKLMIFFLKKAWIQVLRPQRDNPKMVTGSDSTYYSLFQFLHQQMKRPHMNPKTI